MMGAGRRAPWIAGLLIGLAVPALLLPLLRSRLVEGIELKTLDTRMRWRGTAPAAPEIAVVAIDEASVDALGQWPWPREEIARLIGKLHESGARVIALDIVFSEPERGGGEGDARLAEAVRSGVVLGYYFTPGAPAAPRAPQRPRVQTGDPANILTTRIETAVTPPGGFPAVPEYAFVETNIDILAAATPHAGHFVIRPDVDGTVRFYSLILRHAGEYYPALALRAASVFLQAPISLRPYQGNLPLIRLGEASVPASERGELLVNFRGPFEETFPYIPAVDVLDGVADEAALRDRLVFIGATETGIGDLRTTPFDLTAPGVEVHATVADNLIHQRFVRSGAVERLAGIAAMFLLALILAPLAAVVSRAWISAAAAVLLLGGWTGAAQIVFARGHMHLPVVLPLAAGALAFGAATVYRTVFSEAKARLIRRTFQQFVSAAIVEEMLRDPDRVRLGGERRELTVLFSDIRGFTSLSEKLKPEEVVGLLNDYLTPMTRVLLDCGGTLDKYMGDAIMAFFGAPVRQEDHARRACAAALGMRVRLAELNAGWRERGLPPIANGIGINTGLMSVGNMGSEMVFDYTVIGDAANLGSRLEGLNKTYGSEIIVSAFTAAALPEDFVLRELDRVRVKGKSEPVTILELVGRRRADLAAWWSPGGAAAGREAEAPGEDLTRLLAAYAEGLSLFRGRRFEEAAGRFEACLALRPADGPARLYAERCRAMAASPPPPGWDGVLTMESK